MLESNHDQELLRNCEYPWVLKTRISSSYGHLSNDDASALLQEISHGDLQHVVLGHLSEHSNTPQVALCTHVRGFSAGDIHDLHFSLCCGGVMSATPMMGLCATGLVQVA